MTKIEKLRMIMVRPPYEVITGGSPSREAKGISQVLGPMTFEGLENGAFVDLGPGQGQRILIEVIGDLMSVTLDLDVRKS